MTSTTFEVAYSDLLGRYMVAAKDLEMGEIIFEEMPLVCAPERSTDLICPGCYKRTTYQCDDCKWPICSSDCPGRERHSVECSLVKTNAIKITDDEDWARLSDCLMIVRCLALKKMDPKKWEELWNMETNFDQWSKSPLFAQAENLLRTLREKYLISPGSHSANEIQHIQAVLDINAYEVRLSVANIQAVYILASIAEHNCIPNTHRTISGDTLLLTLRAATNIPKGTQLSTSYCDILWPTLQRQKYLKWSKFFLCQCHRCKDPSEMGSYLSCLLCPVCPKGTPVLPLSVNPELLIEGTTKLQYKCSACQKSFDGSVCEKLLDLAEAELQNLDEDPVPEKCSAYEKWLSKWSVPPSTHNNETLEENVLSPVASENGDLNTETKLRLHPHHCLVLDACHTLFLLYSTEESVSTHELRRKETIGSHLLKATQSIITGVSKFQGTVMYELSMTKVGLFVRAVEDSKEANEETQALAKESLSMLQKSLDLLQYEPQDTPEGLLVRTGKNQLVQLKSFVQEIIPNVEI